MLFVAHVLGECDEPYSGVLVLLLGGSELSGQPFALMCELLDLGRGRKALDERSRENVTADGTRPLAESLLAAPETMEVAIERTDRGPKRPDAVAVLCDRIRVEPLAHSPFAPEDLPRLVDDGEGEPAPVEGHGRLHRANITRRLGRNRAQSNAQA